MSVLLQIGHVIFGLIGSGVVAKLLTGVRAAGGPKGKPLRTLFNPGVFTALAGHDNYPFFVSQIFGRSGSNVKRRFYSQNTHNLHRYLFRYYW